MSDDDIGLARMDASHKGSHSKLTKKRKHKESSDTGKVILYIFLVLLALVIVVNIYTILNLKKEIQDKKMVAEEETRPASLNLYLVKDPNCTDCIDLSPLVGSIKNGNIKLQLQKEVLLGTDEAKALVPMYRIKKAPAIVLTGEIDKLPPTTFEKRGDGLVYEPTNPPYTSTATGEIIGLITATVLNDTSCAACFDITQYLRLFEKAGFHISTVKMVDSKTEEGQTLIQNYKISKLPTIVLSKDMGAYPNITQIWSQLGTIEPDGSFILREANPPYRDLDTNTIKGLVGVTYLVYANCTQCYSVLVHKQILNNFGILFGEQKTYDASSDSGKEIVSKYNITKVPTVVLDSEGNAYPNLVRVWNQVGTIEQNAFVFRRVESLGTYYDLTSNQAISTKKEGTNTSSATS
ncbi:MAG: hypothetical protein AABX70_04465 [Nanoarchaeota archaeon]